MKGKKQRFYSAVISIMAFFSACDQADFYDFAQTSGIGPDEKTFISFSINGYEGTIDNAALTISINIPAGMDITSPVTRFSIRGDHVATTGMIIDSGTTSIDYSSGAAAFAVFAMDGTSQTYSLAITFTAD